MRSTHWKGVLILLLTAWGFWQLWPSYKFYSMPREEQESLRDRRNPLLGKVLNLGLDLQGGMHLLLELETDKLPDDRPQTIREAVDRAIEVIRNRIDASGLAEPLIVRQGDKWIVVQLPGVKNPEEARALIGKTALLEFRVVEESGAAAVAKARGLGLSKQQIVEGKIPEEVKSLLPQGTVLLAGREDPYLVLRDKAEMTGASLTSARVEIDNGGQYAMSGPTVALEFSPEGAKEFAVVTEANVGRRMAIVLDGVVQSAPVIRSAIPDGHAIIEGNFSPEEAKFLKAILQAGALPAPLKEIEKRTVGATLGEDSIKGGLNAGLVGLGLIFVFMLVYYRWSGLLANAALLLNMLLLLAVLSALHATLTMPGIAGIILTIGMGVDANVLILERIREELRLGKSPRLAVDQGYERAWSAIFDGNLTTIIAALFLFQFGTGPVKGFGISLIIGLLVSMFTAIVVTHVIYDLWLSSRSVEKLSV